MQRKNMWKEYTEIQQKELEELSVRYKECLDIGKTERECVKLGKKMADTWGYKNYSRDEKYERVNKGGSLSLFKRSYYTQYMYKRRCKMSLCGDNHKKRLTYKFNLK